MYPYAPCSSSALVSVPRLDSRDPSLECRVRPSAEIAFLRVYLRRPRFLQESGPPLLQVGQLSELPAEPAPLCLVGCGNHPQLEAKMFDKTTLSSFINQAQPEDLSAIASQLFTRVGSLDQRQQEQFIEQVQRDPQAKRVFEKMQTYSR